VLEKLFPRVLGTESFVNFHPCVHDEYLISGRTLSLAGDCSRTTSTCLIKKRLPSSNACNDSHKAANIAHRAKIQKEVGKPRQRRF